MSKRLLEIAAFTLQGALTAAANGADRIELCENPFDGGTTPSFGMLQVARDKLHVPVFPIIRPRGGDFVYSPDEIDVMMRDITVCKQLGYEGVVFGILDAVGNVSVNMMKTLVQLASPMQVTMHRAFDRSRDAKEALEDCIACGCARILTSGQHPSVEDGLPLIRDLVELAAGRIIILPGSGLNSCNVARIATISRAGEFHTAARTSLAGDHRYSPATMQENLQFTGVDGREVAAIREVLDQLPDEIL